MKELTIEQKARAYDEAKARMSRAYNSNRCTIGFMNEIFPEFKDEDERIKEEIINYFECQSRDEPTRKDIHNKWIAWLEKQSNNPYNGVSFEYNGNTWGMCARDNGVDILLNRELIQHVSIEKQGEQNPIMAKSPQLGGQKSANNNEPKFHEKDWSIDDYLWQITAKEQLDVLYTKIKEAGYEWDDEKKEFKKIKNPAWSEEDEKAINDIMWIIEAYRKDGFNETHIQMADNSEKWLKSLRPQKQWKPSDEQMEVLEALVEDNNQRYFYTTLNSLYEQLKKLREE